MTIPVTDSFSHEVPFPVNDHFPVCYPAEPIPPDNPRVPVPVPLKELRDHIPLADPILHTGAVDFMDTFHPEDP